ncbi:hypothetical protein NQZ68_029743 [Dissostichus eleginoides]|nr:hypothetical protein NQZ68_029743 [Dissostichus eleginoides]
MFKVPAMHSLSQEIQGFSKSRLKKQCTRVTTVTGRRLLERRGDGEDDDGGGRGVEEEEEGAAFGFVEDTSLDLQVGVVRPFLLLALKPGLQCFNTRPVTPLPVSVSMKLRMSCLCLCQYEAADVLPVSVSMKQLMSCLSADVLPVSVSMKQLMSCLCLCQYEAADVLPVMKLLMSCLCLCQYEAADVLPVSVSMKLLIMKLLMSCLCLCQYEAADVLPVSVSMKLLMSCLCLCQYEAADVLPVSVSMKLLMSCLCLSVFCVSGSQDAAHDEETLQRLKVSERGQNTGVTHVLNVAYGVSNLLPDQLVYKTLQILDLPDTDITSYLEECSGFIELARQQDGVVLVHCNAGVSRSSSVVIGYLMLREGLTFDDAYSQVKLARPSTRPNPGFYQQLQTYKP